MPAAEGAGSLSLDNNRSSSVTLPLQINSNHHQNNHHYDPDFARMEAWLDEHQDFAQNYFMRKATRNVVDSWLVSHATPGSLPNDMMSMMSPTHVNQQQCSSRSGSGATTPVRFVFIK
jgi:dual 3',5'-cyclic-AMP and -GMP phosphodiesterase 11